MPPGAWKFAYHREEHVTDEGIVGHRGPSPCNQNWYNHMPADKIRQLIGTDLWNRYFKFCVIRNPFDMLVSWFYFRLHRGLILGEKSSFEIESFQKCIGQENPVLGRDQYTIDSQLCMGFFIRFEGLYEDLKTVCQRLSLPFHEDRVPKLKMGLRNSNIPLSDFYTPALASRVRDVYEFEIQHFGYNL